MKKPNDHAEPTKVEQKKKDHAEPTKVERLKTHKNTTTHHDAFVDVRYRISSSFQRDFDNTSIGRFERCGRITVVGLQGRGRR